MTDSNRFIDFHTHTKSDSDEVVEILNIDTSTALSLPNSYFSYGIHPWHSTDFAEFIIPKEVKDNPFFIAIGECGLDKLKGGDIKKQLSLLNQHIDASEKYEKPIILHCVRAFNEIIELHKERKPTQPWIIHGFNGSLQLAESLIREGIYLSIGASIMNPKTKISKALKDIPLSHIFLETDDQSKYSIEDVYSAVSQIVEVDVEVLREMIYDNFNKMFRKDE